MRGLVVWTPCTSWAGDPCVGMRRGRAHENVPNFLTCFESRNLLVITLQEKKMCENSQFYVPFRSGVELERFVNS